MYLDLVEMELVNQLSLRSRWEYAILVIWLFTNQRRDFFNALSRLQYLRDEVTATCHKIEEMRAKIKSIQSSVENSLLISQYNQKKKNIKDVHKKVPLTNFFHSARMIN